MARAQKIMSTNTEWEKWLLTLGWRLIPTCSQEIFSKNDRNKVQFISILSEELTREGHDV